MEEDHRQVGQHATASTLSTSSLDQSPGEQRLVPKFASFKPKHEPVHENTSENSFGDRSSARKVEQPGYVHGSGSRQHRRHHRESSRRSAKETRGDIEVLSAVPSREDLPRTESEDLFLIDRKGDPKNLTFGTLHRSLVSDYRRFGLGKVIGSVHGKIDRSRSDNKIITLSSTSGGELENPKKVVLSKFSVSHERTLRIKPQADSFTSDTHADFVPLRSSKARGRKRHGYEDRSESESPSDSVFRGFQSNSTRMVAANQHSDEDLMSGSEGSSSDYEIGNSSLEENTARQKTELSREVDENPTNFQAWLDLIDFQDQILWPDAANGKRKRTRAEEHSVADVKVSIYRKALKAIQKPRDRERLVMGIMEEGSKVWEANVVSLNWEKYLRAHPDSVKLWTAYLDFKENTFSMFRYEDLRAEYARCFRILRQAARDGDTTSLQSSGLIRTYAYILLRLTLMMREAGFTEHAVAIWQAVLEFQYFGPTTSDNEKAQLDGHADEATLTFFESFWESEVPRIGEEGADGWAKFITSPGEPPQPQTDANLDTLECSDDMASWALLERAHSQQAKLPRRTIDDVAENDPSRIVLFSDIRDFLPNFLPVTKKQLYLIKAWLDFCHLPRLASADNEETTVATYGDPFVRKELLFRPSKLTRPWEANWDQATADSGVPGRNGFPQGITPFNIPIADYQSSPLVLFAATDQWFSAFDTCMSVYSQDDGPVSVDWMRRTLAALVNLRIGGEDLAEYYLGLELRLAPDTARKTARKLLKARPRSLRLYNAYACMEYRMSSPVKAQEVILSALTSSRHLEDSLKRDEIFLWHTWIWELLSSQQANQALETILSYPTATPPRNAHSHTLSTSSSISVPPATLLRAQQALTATRDYSISLSLPLHSYLASDLLILLSYLTSSRSLSTAQTTFQRTTTALSTHFPPSSPPHALLHQSFACLLHTHATQTPLFKPALIRDALASSISIFPTNTIFLSLYAWNEARFQIDDRVRAIIADVVLASKRPSSSTSQTPAHEAKDSIAPHLFALSTELHRSLISGSNTNTIRNTFERAVESKAGAHSAALWRLYVEFEIERGGGLGGGRGLGGGGEGGQAGEKESSRAKAIWWRAVRACPGVKALWMLAFEERVLREGMSREELWGVWEMMVEKEVRVYVDLEEWREGKGAEGGRVGFRGGKGG